MASRLWFRILFVLLVVTAFVAAGGRGTPWAAVAACGPSFSEPTLFISCTGSQNTLHVRRDDDGSILVNNAEVAGDPTVTTTDSILVSDGSGGLQLTIDQTLGGFEPGVTPESPGVAEIEWTLSLGSGTGDVITIIGRDPGSDTIQLGQAGINLNADQDVDATHSGVELFAVHGQAGPDFLSAAGAVNGDTPMTTGVFLRGDAGTDILAGGSGPDDEDGGNGNDTLTGGDGDDLLVGLEGDDSLEGQDGDDTLDGGPGTDTLSYFLSPEDVAVILEFDLASGGHADGDTIAGFENLVGSDHPDSLTGSSAANVIDGRGSGDSISAGGGSDTLTYAFSPAAVTINLDTGAASGGFAAGDSFAGIENVFGGIGMDSITGDEGPNLIRGGPGADMLNGGDGPDVLDYSNILVGLTVDLGTGQTSVGDTVSGFEEVNGSQGADTLRGDAGRNIFRPGSGADVVDGKGGKDTVVYAEPGFPFGVEVNLATGTGVGGRAHGDSFEDVENAVGGPGSDELTGNRTANVLEGAGGSDTLDGRGGQDKLVGGRGVDTCVNGEDLRSCEVTAPRQ